MNRTLIQKISSFNEDLFNHCPQWIRFIYIQLFCAIIYIAYYIHPMNTGSNIINGYFNNKIIFIGIVLWFINYILYKL